MRVSELSTRTGVPVPSIKYYLREGLLAPGEPRTATQADYGELHVKRLKLIRALADVAGLPLAQIKRVLALIDDPGDDLFETLGQAVSALPPYATSGQVAEYQHARAAIEHLGWTYDPGYAATAQLDRALAAVDDAGIPITTERLEAYASAVGELAEFDLTRMPQAERTGSDAAPPSSAVEYAVLGTALYEPVVLALRRLAHQNIAARMFGEGGAGGDSAQDA